MRKAGCIILLIGLLIAGGVAFNFVSGWTERGPAARDTAFVVPDGASLPRVAVALRKEGLIKSADAFVTRTKVFDHGARIKAGEYLIPKGASNREILAIITGGVGLNRFVTIPEGMPSIMVYERLNAVDELKGDIAVPVEGSVLPDTYAYDKGETRKAVLARMQSAMGKALEEAWAKRSPTSVAKTRAQAITLASILRSARWLRVFIPIACAPA
jgi:UPF0755 protein